MKLVKRFFKTKILLWKVVGIGLIALLGLVLGLYISFSKANSESNQTTNTYSTIKKIEKVQEVVLLNVGIQKVKTIKDNTKLFGTKFVIPGSEKRAIIILNYTAKFGIKKGVSISKEGEHHYLVTLSKFESIGVELDKDKPYKLYDTSGEILSYSTKDIDTGKAVAEGFSNKEQESYLNEHRSIIEESAEKYYTSLIKSIDSEATVTVESKK